MDLALYIDRGGIIVYILIAMSIIGFTIMFFKFFVILVASIKYKQISIDILNEINLKKEYEISHIQLAVALKVKKLESGLNTVKIIASLSPLLGLLGTVIGILNSFDSITHMGLGDPTIFSSGISVALITTVAGLVVAIPHFIGYNYFIGTLDSLEIKMEKYILDNLK
jgi:biopolymer transport protein ExbB